MNPPPFRCNKYYFLSNVFARWRLFGCKASIGTTFAARQEHRTVQEQQLISFEQALSE